MQVGESIAIVTKMQEDGKCVICSQNHEQPKKEEIKETAPNDSGWKRKSMNGVFESTPKKLAIYPNNSFPPTYQYQGHHCMALSAFVKNSDKPDRADSRIRLNHFLKKIGFFPNRDRNCIGLPARKNYGDFKAFWDSFDAKKPLQLHGPGHDNQYFMQVNNLINRMLGIINNPDFCQELTKSEWQDQLKTAIESAENYSFNKLAKNRSSWCLHPQEQRVAIEIYTSPRDRVFNVIGAYNANLSVPGKGNIDSRIEFPDPKLDEGPFRGT